MFEESHKEREMEERMMKIEFSMTRLLKAGAAIFVVLALAAALAGGIITLWTRGEQQAAQRINALIDADDALPRDREDQPRRENEVGEITNELLSVAEKTNNSGTRGHGYGNAGLAMAAEYSRQNEVFKVSPIQLESERPSRGYIDSAEEYLAETARVCAGQSGCAEQLWAVVQRNLDYAVRESRARKELEEERARALRSRKDAQEERTDAKDRKQRSESGASDVASQEQEERNSFGEDFVDALLGSIRGMYRQEESACAPDDPDGKLSPLCVPAPGGGFRIAPNVP